MRFWLYRYFASAEALDPGTRAISPWSVRGEESGDLVGVHPVVAALVSLGRDVAVADGDEDRGARYACGADRFRHLDALGHTLMVPLLGLATIDAVAHHPQRFFDQGERGQRVCSVGEFPSALVGGKGARRIS